MRRSKPNTHTYRLFRLFKSISAEPADSAFAEKRNYREH
jgi:hypothetical protein